MSKSADDFDPIADANLCDDHQWAGHGMCPHCAEEDSTEVAYAVLHHMDTMYPAMWKAVSKTARMSIRNTIRAEVKRRLLRGDSNG